MNNEMEELVDFLDTHPEVRPMFRGELLELVARTPGMAILMIPCFEKVSFQLREKLADQLQREIDLEER